MKVAPIISLLQTRESSPKVWDFSKFPVSNAYLADYDLKLDVKVVFLMLNGKNIALPEVDPKRTDTEIKELNAKITELKTQKGTLDELELTK